MLRFVKGQFHEYQESTIGGEGLIPLSHVFLSQCSKAIGGLVFVGVPQSI